MEFTLLWAALIGVAALWLAVRILDRDGAISEVVPGPFDALLGAAIGGLVVGRLWAMVADGVNPLTNPLDIILVRAGVDTLGASLGAVAVITWSFRTRLPAALDAVAAPALVGLAGWHAGCLARGSCSANGQPVELHTALGLLATAALAPRWWLRGPAPGAVASFGLAAASAVRLVTEPFRFYLGNGQVVLYAVGLGVGLVGLIVAEVVERAGTTQAQAHEERDELGGGEHQPDEHHGHHDGDA